MNLLIALLFASVVSHPAKASRTGFVIGESYEEVHKHFGEPKGYYSAGQEYKSFPFAASASVLEIYRRIVHGREYELLLDYRSDASLSRLHPTLRLEEVTVRLDHPVPARVLLSDLIESTDACKAGCDAFLPADGDLTPNELRVRQHEYGDGPQFELLLENSTPEDVTVKVVDLDSIVTRAIVLDFRTMHKYETIAPKLVGTWKP